MDTHDDCALVTVLVSGAPARARAVARRRGLRAPVLLDPDRALRRRFGVDRTPTTFLLGPDGRARAVLRGAHSREGLARAVEPHR